MRTILSFTSAVALLASLGAAPALAQNAAEQRADRMFGDRTDSGVIQNVDEMGRIIEVDGIRYLLDESINPSDLNAGQRVEVVFEQASLGTELVALDVDPVVE